MVIETEEIAPGEGLKYLEFHHGKLEEGDAVLSGEYEDKVLQDDVKREEDMTLKQITSSDNLTWNIFTIEKYFWNIFQFKTIKTHYSQLEDFQPCFIISLFTL